MGTMKASYPLLASSSYATGLVAATIALILLTANFTIINAQQQEQLTSQPSTIEDGTETRAESTTDSFRIQVPDGWTIQDMNNTGSALLEESTQGYGILAQLCPDEEEQEGRVVLSTDARGSTNSSSNNRCQGTTDEVVHIVRYPDLNTRLQAANNGTATFNNNNNNNTTITTDNVLSYHLQRLQEVGYRSIQIVNSTDVTLNLTNAQTDETIATVPAKLVELTYGTASAPNEIRRGYFISTSTNATLPNPGTTTGYSVFYEGNSTATTPSAEIARLESGSLPLSLPLAVAQAFDSFELIAAPEVAQAGAAEPEEPADTEDSDSGTDTEETNETKEEEEDDNNTATQNEDVEDTDSDDDDGSDSSTDANRREITDREEEEEEEEEEDSECGGVTVGGTSAANDYGCPPDPDD